MKKDEFKHAVQKCGDAVITYRSTNSRKLKYNVCTLDFDNKYSRNETGQKNLITQFFCFVGTQTLIDYYNQKM